MWTYVKALFWTVAYCLSTDQDEIRRRQLDGLDQMERRAEAERRRREAEGT